MELQFQCLVKFVGKISRTRIAATLILENFMTFIPNKTGEEKQVIRNFLGLKCSISSSFIYMFL